MAPGYHTGCHYRILPSSKKFFWTESIYIAFNFVHTTSFCLYKHKLCPAKSHTSFRAATLLMTL